MVGFIGTIAGGAIAFIGSIIGTYIPQYYAKKRQVEEEKRFNAAIRTLVKLELENSLSFINSFQENDELTQEDAGTFISFPREYKNIPVERRAIAFKLQTLSKIERAYNYFDIYISVAKRMFPSPSSTISFKDISEKVGTETLKKRLNDAIDSIKEEEDKYASKTAK
jgi:hypothetical protein